MSSFEQLKQVLAPLGVYTWDGSFQEAELRTIGTVLDAQIAQIAKIAREMHLTTAEDLGLENICRLLPSVPITHNSAELRLALAALLRISDHHFTADAIADNISGCGLPAHVEETDTPCQIKVSFPDIGGIPEDFALLRPIIENIAPAHVEIIYHFWYLTWKRLEEKLPTWKDLDAKGFCFKEFERFVRDA